MKKVEIVAKAHARYVRVSARKVRLVIDLIRGEKVGRALAILANTNKRARVYVEKALRSAISNARGNPAIDTEQLFISKIIADNGPQLKRYRAAAMGRATMIRKRTTHLTVELAKSAAGKVPTEKKKIQKGKSRRR